MQLRSVEKRIAMGGLGRSAAKSTAFAGLLVLGAATLAGLVRALPWIVAADVPIRVVLPFAGGLLAVGLEVALLCAPPIGWALSAGRFVERGEARALHAIGVSPWNIARTTLRPALACAALAALSALAWGTEAAAPGRLARSLVQRAAESCEGARVPRTAQIPLLNLSWVCFPHQPPRLVGPLPGAGSNLFSATGITISDDLRTVQLSDMHALMGPFRVGAGTATFRNLAPFGRASNLHPAARSLLLGVTGALLALSAAGLVVRSGNANRFFALALGIAGPVAAVGLMTWLERRSMPTMVYLLMPAAGLAAMACVAGLAIHGRTLRRRQRGGQAGAPAI